MSCMTISGVAIEAAGVRRPDRRHLTRSEVREARALVARAMIRGLKLTKGQAA